MVEEAVTRSAGITQASSNKRVSSQSSPSYLICMSRL